MAKRLRRSTPAAALKAADGGCPCPTNGVIELVGKRWTLCVTARLGQAPGIRFNDLQDSLPGISPRTLSETLKELGRHGILERRSFAEVPPRVEYALTPKGAKLLEAAAPLLVWAQGHEGSCCD